MNDWNDDRPGMMRVHIADQRTRDLCDTYTRDWLRRLARSWGLPTGGRTKYDIAWSLIMEANKTGKQIAA